MILGDQCPNLSQGGSTIGRGCYSITLTHRMDHFTCFDLSPALWPGQVSVPLSLSFLVCRGGQWFCHILGVSWGLRDTHWEEPRKRGRGWADGEVLS